MFEGSFLDNNYLRLGITNTIYLWGVFLILRFVLLYFDHKKDCQLLAYKWKSQLQNELKSVDSKSPTHSDDHDIVTSDINSNCKEELPWTMKHQSKFNNTIRMHAICCLIWIMNTSINLICYYFSETLFNYVQSAGSGIIVALLFVGYYFIRNCRDEINIRR